MPPPLQMKACHWILSRLSTPYRMAITDSLDFQVAPASLRIQFPCHLTIRERQGFNGKRENDGYLTA